MDRSELPETNGVKRDDAADERDASSFRRDAESELRDGAADARDTLAADRDHAATVRDRAADDRDAASARMRMVHSTTESAPEAFMRQNSAADRKWSSESRDAAGTERGQAASDRGSSASDRLLSARERTTAATDALTGAYLRGPGIAELQRELERAVRTASPLVLAFVDVDALKTVNDTHGHAAGDRLLTAVVRVLGEKLRLYDRIVRYGGDEFVCALSGMTEADAAKRFEDVNASLTAAAEPGSVTFGLAALAAGDSVDTLIARADRELYRKRGRL